MGRYGGPVTVPGPWQRAARGAMLLSDEGELRPTIFAEMSALAARTGSINLGQGFPDEDGPAEVLEAARQAISDGANQYPPGLGILPLREAIADHQQRFYGIHGRPRARGSRHRRRHRGDRRDPARARRRGRRGRHPRAVLRLLRRPDRSRPRPPRDRALRAPDFRPDLDEFRAAVTDRTRVILLNSPHNPTGVVLDRAFLELAVELAHRHDAILVTDEVYEHLTFGVEHVPVATLPGARERTVTISSGGKTFSTTGWKVGWITTTARTARPDPRREAVPHLRQRRAVPAGDRGRTPDAGRLLRGRRGHSRGKRDLLSAGLRAAGFDVSRPDGSYFVIADAAPLGYPDAVEFCRRLPELAGVVAIPLTAFVRPEHRAGYASLVRFAFCKRVEVLETAAYHLRVAERMTPDRGYTERSTPSYSERYGTRPPETRPDMPNPAPDLDEVLDITAELVIKDSLGAVTIRSVASRLDLSDDELLHLFPTLTDLLVSMVNREYAAMFRVVLDNVERDPLGGLLSRIVRYTLTAIYERELARALYLSDPDGLNSVMRASYGLGHTPHLRLRSSFIEQMQLAGMVREDVDPEWVTAAVSTLAAGMALTSPHDDLDDIVDGISLMLDRSVDVAGRGHHAGQGRLLRVRDQPRQQNGSSLGSKHPGVHSIRKGGTTEMTNMYGTGDAMSASSQRERSSLWWLAIVRGVFAIIFGILALTWPVETVVVLTLVFAIYAIVDGIVNIVAAIATRKEDSTWGWLLTQGILTLIVGLFALFAPTLRRLTSSCCSCSG